MKKLVLIVIPFLIFSCGNSDSILISREEYNKVKGIEEPKTFTVPDVTTGVFQTIVIDSCEYLFLVDGGGYNGGQTITHKGNCKFCEKRNEK